MIVVTDLVKRHGELEVLRGISMTVEKGSVHVIVGPSGGGKSTFLRCINGLEPFQKGRVKVGDHVLDPLADARRDAIGERVDSFDGARCSASGAEDGGVACGDERFGDGITGDVLARVEGEPAKDDSATS